MLWLTGDLSITIKLYIYKAKSIQKSLLQRLNTDKTKHKLVQDNHCKQGLRGLWATFMSGTMKVVFVVIFAVI